MIKDMMARDLKDLTFSASALNTASPNVNRNGQDFDQFMARLDARESAAEHRRQENPDNRRSERSENSPEPQVREVLTSHNEVLSTDIGQEDRTDEVLESSEVAGVDTNYVQEETLEDEEIQADIVYNLAEAVYVMPEVVYEMLEALEIKPVELAEPQAANKYLQNLLKVESPVELLTMPEYQEALKQVAEAVTQIIEAGTQADKPKPALEKLSGLVALVDEKNQLVVMEAEVLEDSDADEEEEPFQPLERRERPEVNQNSQNTQAVQTENAANVVAEAPEVLLQEAQPVSPVTAVNPAASLAAIQTPNAAEVSTATRVDPTMVMEQIVSKVKTISPENFSELRMTLRPEHLGDVTLRIAVQNGIVTAMFVAESQRIKEIIEQNFNLLRDALEEQGIEVADLFVSVDSGNPEEQANQFLKAQQEALRRLQRAAGTAEAEVIEEETPVVINMDNTVDFSA